MKVLLSTIPSDSHMWNLVFLQLYLEEMGHEVINLGACVPVDLLLTTMEQYEHDVVVISSINGHANMEGLEIGHRIRRHPKLNKKILVIGGKLGTKGKDNIKYKKQLIYAGFNKVFVESDPLDDFKLFMQKIEADKYITSIVA